jgi:hypothetical protein
MCFKIIHVLINIKFDIQEMRLVAESCVSLVILHDFFYTSHTNSDTPPFSKHKSCGWEFIRSKLASLSTKNSWTIFPKLRTKWLLSAISYKIYNLHSKNSHLRIRLRYLFSWTLSQNFIFDLQKNLKTAVLLYLPFHTNLDVWYSIKCWRQQSKLRNENAVDQLNQLNLGYIQ